MHTCDAGEWLTLRGPARRPEGQPEIKMLPLFYDQASALRARSVHLCHTRFSNSPIKSSYILLPHCFIHILKMRCNIL